MCDCQVLLESLLYLEVPPMVSHIPSIPIIFLIHQLNKQYMAMVSLYTVDGIQYDNMIHNHITLANPEVIEMRLRMSSIPGPH